MEYHTYSIKNRDKCCKKNVHSSVRDQGSNKFAFKLTSSMSTHLSKEEREEEHPGQMEHCLQRPRGRRECCASIQGTKGARGTDTQCTGERVTRNRMEREVGIDHCQDFKQEHGKVRSGILKDHSVYRVGNKARLTSQ